jgi:hypothetical protein
MNAFLKGIISLFSWIDCHHNLSPKERVDEILDDFYLDHPWIERDDLKALQNDFERALNEHETNDSFD